MVYSKPAYINLGNLAGLVYLLAHRIDDIIRFYFAM